MRYFVSGRRHRYGGRRSRRSGTARSCRRSGDSRAPNHKSGRLARHDRGARRRHRDRRRHFAAAVVGRALGLPCVVGCGKGSLTALHGEVVDASTAGPARFSPGRLDRAPDESDHAALAPLRVGGGARALRVVAPPTAADSTRSIAALDRGGRSPHKSSPGLEALRGARGARGGAIASDEGVPRGDRRRPRVHRRRSHAAARCSRCSRAAESYPAPPEKPNHMTHDQAARHRGAHRTELRRRRIGRRLRAQRSKGSKSSCRGTPRATASPALRAAKSRRDTSEAGRALHATHATVCRI